MPAARTQGCVRSWRALLSSEALTKQVRQLNKERAAVATKAGLKLSGEGIVSVVGEVVVVTSIEGGAGIRRIAEEELAAGIRRERVVIDARPRKNKPAELIGRSKRIDVVLKGEQAGIIAAQLALLPVERHAQRLRRLKISAQFDTERLSRTRVEARIRIRQGGRTHPNEFW